MIGQGRQGASAGGPGKRILVLGGGGMLGHKVVQTLSARWPGTLCTLRGVLEDAPFRSTGLYRPETTVEHVDAMDWPGLARLLGGLRPDVVVNCIGIVKQRPQAQDPIPSIAINSLLPHRLAAECAGWGGRLIHFSTDCVFSGRRGGYTEDDSSDAQDLYGRSKLLGETREANALTLRTSIIGRELAHFHSLLEWFLAQRGGTVRGFTRAVFSGVTTNHLARIVARVIGERPDLHGLYHLASEPITKHDLLGMLRVAYDLDVEIIADGGEICDRSLIGERFVRETGWSCPSWPELLQELVEDPTPYARWRSSGEPGSGV